MGSATMTELLNGVLAAAAAAVILFIFLLAAAAAVILFVLLQLQLIKRNVPTNGTSTPLLPHVLKLSSDKQCSH